MSLTRHAIRVYAALDGLKEKNDDDVIDSLLPFLLPVLEVMRGTAFSPQLIVAGVKRLYGWNIGTAVAEVFRDRLAAKGYLRREIVDRTTVFICDPPAEPQQTAAEVATSTALERVMDDFEVFPEKLSSLFHIEKSRDELREMLVRFLIGLDAFGQNEMLDELRSIANGSNEERKLAALKEGGAPLSDEDKYLCARFVASLYKGKSLLVQHLSQIASVGLLTEVVKDFAKPSGIVKRSNLTIALDAPLALNLLGTSGQAAAAEAAEVVESLRSVGCNFIVFGRSCEEIARVLSSLLSTPRPNRHGFTHSAIVRGEVSEDYVRLVRDDPEGALQKRGIGIRNISLDQYPNLHQFFPAEVTREFADGLHWYNDEARGHDAECVSFVMRLRSGRHQRDPLSCEYVLATSNSRLTSYSRDFCLARSFMNSRHCGPVINHRDMATIAWLRTGFSGGADIPRAHLLATCDKVLRVRKEVVNRARDVVSSVHPGRLEQFELLLQDKRSVMRLLDDTFGNETRIDEAGIERLLDDMQRALVADVEAEYEAKLREQRDRQNAIRQGERKRFAKELQQKSREASDATSKLQSMSERVETLEKQSHENEQRNLAGRQAAVASLSQIVDRINTRSRSVDLWVTRVLWGGALVALGEAVGSLLEFTPSYPIVRWVGIPFGILATYHFIQDFRCKPVLGLSHALGRWARASLSAEVIRRGLDADKLSRAISVEDGNLTLDRDMALELLA